MAKKKFASPFVFTVQPVDDPVIGNASAHGYVDDEGASQAWPMPYGLWLDEVGTDVDGSGGIPDWNDYKAWFVNNGLNTDLMEPAENPNP
jgi:hypothetical protein